ncbi:HPr(Ser) kinase/phosphatase [Mycoplasmopsis gallinacea]|uniref:HPr kinase/phosphorylase n=1 Tax=Mycoplasmopsis gallinacea TaxID=29556 RepID=A0A6H0V4U1_9BACT|nr:HPr(Ser) kinase/phosphatase [Mycoplasmopsis gallinacea]QIW61993.1 HPr kinase/phosphorylase [Mycoplasmopsis gallinacea]
MIKTKVNVKEVINFFELKLVNTTKELNYNDILVPTIKRAGLELAEKISNGRINMNVIVWGTSENYWFKNLGKTQAQASIHHVLQHQPPLLLLSKGVDEEVLEWIIEVADMYKVPVSHMNSSTSQISIDVSLFLNNFFSEEAQVHGCLVLVGGVGVMIIGDSGVGKSEAALELVQKGHILISDDSVIIKNVGNMFIGRSPKITRNMLEVRGIGIIDVKYTYGIRSVASSCQINLVVELVKKDRQNDLDRLGIEILKYPVLNRSIKKIMVPIKEGGSVASLIEAAVSTYLSRHDGLNVLEEMERRRMEGDN